MTPVSLEPNQRSDARNAVIVGSVVIAYGSQFWPESLVFESGMTWLGNPPYEGFTGVFLPHLLLYTTLMAAVCGGLWLVLFKTNLMPPMQLANFRRALLLGAIGGIVAFVLSVPAVWVTMGPGSVRWIPPNGWTIAGNVFSNFYEEFVYRGFFLTGLRLVVGFWPAAVISSAMWAALHLQYPIALRIFIALIGMGFCWLARRAQSFWAPYTAHMVLDVLADSAIG